jgi:hypothetical protein
LVFSRQEGRETERRHFHLLSKENQVKIPELGNKYMFVVTQLNLEKLRKGMRLIFLSQDKDIFTYGDVNELRDAGVSPGKSSLLFLTVASPPRRGDAHGIGSTGDMGERLAKCSIFRSIWCAHIGP